MTDEYTGEQHSEAAAPVEAVQETQEQAQQVPLDALQQERAQRQQLQEEVRVLKDHFALMQAQSQRQQQPKQDEFNGLTDDDVLTVGEFKKALSQKERQYQMSLEELKMAQKHSDYQEVITQYLPEVLKSNPALRRSLEQSQDYELAYYLAKNSEGYKASKKEAKKSEEAKRILENTQRPGSLSAVGKAAPQSSTKNWKQMSDAEFMQQVQRNLGYV